MATTAVSHVAVTPCRMPATAARRQATQVAGCRTSLGQPFRQRRSVLLRGVAPENDREMTAVGGPSVTDEVDPEAVHKHQAGGPQAADQDPNPADPQAAEPDGGMDLPDSGLAPENDSDMTAVRGPGVADEVDPEAVHRQQRRQNASETSAAI